MMKLPMKKTRVKERQARHKRYAEKMNESTLLLSKPSRGGGF